MSDTGAKEILKSELEEYQKNKAEYAATLKKINDLELSVAENKDVLETLSGMDVKRRCYRVVDSILVERNVGEVKDALEVEKNNMMVLMGQLNTRSRELEKLITSFEVDFWLKL